MGNRSSRNLKNKSLLYDNNVTQIKKEDNYIFLKIYLCGSGKGINYLLNNFFKDYITDQFLKEKGDSEIKTNKFHWILSDYSSNKLTDEICKIIIDEMKADRFSDIKEKNKKILDQQAFICFGEKNIQTLCKYFKEMREPRIISVTESKCEINIDKRYVTNIITEGMNEDEIISFIKSTLLEIEYYYNGKGNFIQDNIFNDLEKDNSLFSLNILLLGKSRTGKSTLINLIFLNS